jgi:hypothetical protein
MSFPYYVSLTKMLWYPKYSIVDQTPYTGELYMNTRVSTFAVISAVFILTTSNVSANPTVGKGAAWVLGAVLGPAIDWSVRKYLNGDDDNSAQAASPRNAPTAYNIPAARFCVTPIGQCPLPPMMYPRGEDCYCFNLYSQMEDYGITR